MKKIILIALGSLLMTTGKAAIILTSNDFAANLPIPAKFTCDGRNISPHLAWKNIPAKTKSIAIICEDPDAPGGTWTHWIVFNIPPTISQLEQNTPKKTRLSNGICQGINSSQEIGYTGACPPRGTHRYFFKIYALDTKLKLSPGKATRNNLLKAIKNHILDQDDLMGTYARN